MRMPNSLKPSQQMDIFISYICKYIRLKMTPVMLIFNYLMTSNMKHVLIIFLKPILLRYNLYMVIIFRHMVLANVYNYVTTISVKV